jgi:Zn-finger nucleic acid-binding protein
MEQKKIEIERLDLPFVEDTSESTDDTNYFININCPSCNEVVVASNIELESKVGKCSNCNALFSVKNEVEKLIEHSKTKEKILRPEGVESFHFRNEFEIEVNQPVPVLDIVILALVPFIIIFSTLLYFLKGFNTALTICVISSLILTKGILRVAQRKRYKTYLTIKKDYIYVQDRPKSFRKDKEFSVLNLDQVYVKQTTDGAGLFFIVNGINGQRHEQVLGRFQNVGKLKYIEQEIESYLKIQDRRISGEI